MRFAWIDCEVVRCATCGNPLDRSSGVWFHRWPALPNHWDPPHPPIDPSVHPLFDEGSSDDA